MLDPAALVARAAESGYDLFTGVPCSFLAPLINHLVDAGDRYVPLNNEGEAVSYACGAYLAGRRPVVAFQNSGLGNAVNPLTSLAIPYRIPLLLVATWRGEPGRPDEPQHEVMGRITVDMLTVMGIANDVLSDGDQEAAEQLARAAARQAAVPLPYGLVLRGGTLAPRDLRATPERGDPSRAVRADPREEGPAVSTRIECLRSILSVTGPDDVLVATTGKTGRELFTLRDAPGHLYLVGAMGCAGSVALGIARHAPAGPRVVVIDGDGAALMRLEALASIGHYAPPNLVHVVLDNNAHDSTGGQQTLSATVEFDRVAAAVGYRRARSLATTPVLEAELERALSEPGPTFLHVRIRPGSASPLGRPTVAPWQVAERLRGFLGVDSHVAA